MEIKPKFILMVSTYPKVLWKRTTRENYSCRNHLKEFNNSLQRTNIQIIHFSSWSSSSSHSKNFFLFLVFIHSFVIVHKRFSLAFLCSHPPQNFLFLFLRHHHSSFSSQEIFFEKKVLGALTAMINFRSPSIDVCSHLKRTPWECTIIIIFIAELVIISHLSVYRHNEQELFRMGKRSQADSRVSNNWRFWCDWNEIKLGREEKSGKMKRKIIKSEVESGWEWLLDIWEIFKRRNFLTTKKFKGLVKLLKGVI